MRIMLGDKIKELRKRDRRTQDDLATALGITNQAVSRWEANKAYPDMEMILHTDQGSVYASKSFNELLPLYHIVHSMSRAGTPTDNAAMEAINGWIKAEVFNDLHLTGNDDVQTEVERYIVFFNEERPAYSLNYLTPKQYREYHAQ